MNAPLLALTGPSEMGEELAKRVRALRLLKGLTRETLALRSGVSLASLKRFERSGKTSLDLILKVSHALSRLEEWKDLFLPPVARSIAELEKRTEKLRQRGRI